MKRAVRILHVNILCLLFTIYAQSQNLTQVVRGTVIDAETQMPLPFANISVTSLSTPIGTTTNNDGVFRLENVPVGRHTIQFSFIGYKSKIIAELMVTSGKELILNIALKESLAQVEEITVKGFSKDRPQNSMATLSARTFSVEEANRYAGGFDDPARLASSFAGVSTGYLDDNGIIVRGNAPKGLLWRLEGAEIPNPNHFANLSTIGGGGISALSSLMLANSDFYTGAFPAEYGNALSGVFDINLRNGNNEKHEHAFQIGALGLDISSEGPFSKKSKASYLFNYRYSTFGLIKPILPEDSNIPVYQDLSFKINLPTEKAGTFSLWGLAAVDNLNMDGEVDSTLWETIYDKEVGDVKQNMGAIGINHKYILGQKTYIKSLLVASGNTIKYDEGILDSDLQKHPNQYIDNKNYKYTFSTTLNHKFGSKHTNRTGFTLNNYHYKSLLKYAPEIGDSLLVAANENGASNLFQLHSQSKIDLTEKFSMNLGVHAQYFSLNKEFLIEPRLGVTYKINHLHSLGFAYGSHSRLEPQSLYFARVNSGDIISTPNKDLPVTKAHHLVFSYDVSLSNNVRLKIEPFAQFLYDVPVSPDSTYSAINMEGDWFFSKKLESTGTGTNIGIDFTMERFLKDGYYYLLTASLFESKFIAGDKVERLGRYSSKYAVNLLFGKEWVFGSNNNKILGVNGRINFLGGQRITPVDEELSHQNKYIVYDYSRPFEEEKPAVYHVNTSVSWRINKKNHSSIWSLQVLNLLGSKEFYGYKYNYRTNTIEEDSQAVVVPSLSYKIEF
jgi:hypothetical protein